MPVSRMMKCSSTCSWRALFHRHFQGDLAGLGKFDGVPQQVHDDLANPDLIADHIVGHIRLPLAQQLQIFLVSAHGQRAHRFVQIVAQIEANRIQLQPARLDFRKVQNVVDDGEQRVRRALHRAADSPSARR